MKHILIFLIFMLTATICYSLTVGRKTGFDNGLVVGGKTGFIPSISTPTPPTGDALLLESGDYILLENGDKLLLE